MVKSKKIDVLIYNKECKLLVVFVIFVRLVSVILLIAEGACQIKISLFGLSIGFTIK